MISTPSTAEPTAADFFQRCPDCGHLMSGLPWHGLSCTGPGCRVHYAPDWFHPDAPDAIRESGTARLARLMNCLIGEGRPHAQRGT